MTKNKSLRTTASAALLALAIGTSGCITVRTTSLEGTSRLKILAFDTRAELMREFGAAEAETTDGRYVLYSLAKEASWYWVGFASSSVDEIGSNSVGETHVLFEFDAADRNVATRFNHCGEDARSAVCSLDSMSILFAMVDELHGAEEANRQRELEVTHAALAEAMHTAAAAGDVAAIDALIAQGGSPTAHREGMTLLHRAAAAGQPEVISYLIDNGVPVDSLTVRAGQSALHLAAAAGQIETMHRLLAAGAQIDFADVQDHTPLRVAVGADEAAAARLLLDHGADANAGPNDILIVATENGDIGLVRALLEHGADPNGRVSVIGGRPALHYAVQTGRTDIAALLLEHGADLSIGPDRYYPLHAAVDREDPDMVALLLEHGADPNKRVRIRGIGRVTPSERASRSNSEEILALLERYGARG